MTDELRALFVDWLNAETSLIYEHSGNITADSRALIVQARTRAAALNLEWSDDLVPISTRDAADCYGDEPDWDTA